MKRLPATTLGPVRRRRLFERLRAANPAPRGELQYRTPYQLLVAVILSAQATDRSVNLVTRELFPIAGTPGRIVALGEARLGACIRTIGLWRAKARHIIAMSRILLERHGGQVPREREALESLPGVGRKSANILLNVAFGESTIAVDTHVFRVANRTGLAPGSNVREVEKGLLADVPEEFRRDAHHWLILHGRHVCTARRPACPTCLIADLCRYPEKTRAGEQRPAAAGTGAAGRGPATVVQRRGR